MKLGPIVSLFVCMALVGWFAPDLSTVPGRGMNTAESAADADAKLAVNRTQAWLAGQSVLRRQPDGHFYADAIVEGQNIHFLVDTGATIVALTGDDAEALGLYWHDQDLRPIGRGASGIVYGLPATIKVMELGGLEARNVEAAIIPEGLGVSLLGQSFLSKIDNVEIAGDEMRLGG